MPQPNAGTTRLSPPAWSATQLTRLIVIVLVCITAISGGLALRDARESAISCARQYSRSVATAIDGFLEATETMLLTLASLPELQDAKPEEVWPLLRRVLSANHLYVNVWATRLDGQNYASAARPLEEPQANIGDREYFLQAIATGRMAVQSVPDDRLHPTRFAVAMATPVRGAEGDLVGTVSAGFELLNLQYVLESVDLPEGTVVEIVDESGYIVARSEDSAAWVGRNIVGTGQWDRFVAAGEGAFAGKTSDGVERLTGYSAPLLAPWRISVGIPAAAVYPNLAGVLARELGILVVAYLAIGRFAFRLASLSREHGRQKALLHQLIDHAPFAIAVIRGADLVYEFANPAYCRIPGIGREVVGRPLRHVIKLSERATECLKRACETGHPVFVGECEEQTAQDGRKTYWDVHIIPLPKEDGVSRILVIADDVTAAVHARGRTAELIAELQERRSHAERQASQMAAVMNSMTDAVTVFDRDGNVTRYNSRAAEIIGVADGNVRRVVDYPAALRTFTVDGDEVPRSEWLVQRLLSGESPLETEYIVETPQGARRRIICCGSTVRDSEGRPELAVIVMRDVTELRQLQQAKDDFLQIMAHELRNPLTAAMGLVQLTARGLKSRSDDRHVRQLELADSELKRLSGLLNDIISGYRASSGRLELLLEELDLGELVQQALAPYSLEGAKHDIVLRRPPYPVPVHGDTRRLVEVVANLMSNAAKYSPEGTTIWVDVESGGGHATVTVADEGIGIPEDQLERVFDGFYRASNVTNRQPGGLGLGLYICRDIVRRHGGEIWAQSREEGGAAMTVRMPLAGGGGTKKVAG